MGNISQKSTFLVDLDEEGGCSAEYMQLQDSSSVSTTLSTTSQRLCVPTQDSVDSQLSDASLQSSVSEVPSVESRRGGFDSIQSVEMDAVSPDPFIAQTPEAAESDVETSMAMSNSSASDSFVDSSSSEEIVSQSESSDVFATPAPRCSESMSSDISFPSPLPSTFEVTPIPAIPDDGTFCAPSHSLLLRNEQNIASWLRGPFSATKPLYTSSSNVSLAATIDSESSSTDSSSALSTESSQSFPHIPRAKMPLFSSSTTPKPKFSESSENDTTSGQVQAVTTPILSSCPRALRPSGYNLLPYNDTNPSGVYTPTSSALAPVPKPTQPASMKTYADATNLANQYPNLAPIILSHPLDNKVETPTPAQKPFTALAEPELILTAFVKDAPPVNKRESRGRRSGSTAHSKENQPDGVRQPTASSNIRDISVARKRVRGGSNASAPADRGRTQGHGTQRAAKKGGNVQNLPKRPVFTPMENGQNYYDQDVRFPPPSSNRFNFHFGRMASDAELSSGPDKRDASLASSTFSNARCGKSAQGSSFPKSQDKNTTTVEAHQRRPASGASRVSDPPRPASSSTQSVDVATLGRNGNQISFPRLAQRLGSTRKSTNPIASSLANPKVNQNRQQQAQQKRKRTQKTPGSDLASRISNLRVHPNSGIYDSMHAPDVTASSKIHQGPARQSSVTSLARFCPDEAKENFKPATEHALKGYYATLMDTAKNAATGTARVDLGASCGGAFSSNSGTGVRKKSTRFADSDFGQVEKSLYAPQLLKDRCFLSEGMDFDKECNLSDAGYFD